MTKRTRLPKNRPPCPHVDGPYCALLRDRLGWNDAVEPVQCGRCWALGGENGGQGVRDQIVQLTIGRVMSRPRYLWSERVAAGVEKNAPPNEYAAWAGNSVGDHQEYHSHRTREVKCMLKRMEARPGREADIWRKYLNNPLGIMPTTKCVLVGNGPSIHGSGLGEAIDSHAEVVRFNRFRCRGDWERDAGNRTTIWSTFGEGELPECESRPTRIILWSGSGSPHPDYPKSTVWRVPPSFYAKVRSAVGSQPSSGLLIAAWLLDQVYDSISVAGFDHFGHESGRHHYWDSHTYLPPKAHDGANESRWFAERESEGRIVRL